MARKQGSKDKQKRKKRLPGFVNGANIATAALIGLGAAAGSEGLHRYKYGQVSKEIAEKNRLRNALRNRRGPKGDDYVKQIRKLNAKRHSKEFMIKNRVTGGVAGGASGYLASQVLVPRKANKEGGNPRKGLAHINSTSREIRGYASLALRLLK